MYGLPGSIVGLECSHQAGLQIVRIKQGHHHWREHVQYLVKSFLSRCTDITAAGGGLQLLCVSSFTVVARL